jgi:hypothetical protein
MNALAARSRADGQSIIKWTTGYEAENLGLNVYREAGNGRVRLNNQLIAGLAFVTNAAMTAGRTYRWRDSLPPGKSDARYYVEEIDLNGESKWHGPILTTDIMGTVKDVDFDLLNRRP